jgi:hypothetical protein
VIRRKEADLSGLRIAGPHPTEQLAAKQELVGVYGNRRMRMFVPVPTTGQQLHRSHDVARFLTTSRSTDSAALCPTSAIRRAASRSRLLAREPEVGALPRIPRRARSPLRRVPSSAANAILLGSGQAIIEAAIADNVYRPVHLALRCSPAAAERRRLCEHTG